LETFDVLIAGATANFSDITPLPHRVAVRAKMRKELSRENLAQSRASASIGRCSDPIAGVEHQQNSD
jgi:hypothetical protein